MSSIISLNVETKTNSSPSLYSKEFGGKSSEVKHFIDWDISVAILNSNGKLLSQECFIF
jgi:stress response protein SCP2